MLHDLVQFARMSVPLDDDVTAARLGWAPADRAVRLRLVCDEYGLDAAARREALDLVGGSFDLAAEFVRRRVDAGDAAFVERLDRLGGPQRFERRRLWWSSRRDEFAHALG